MPWFIRIYRDEKWVGSVVANQAPGSYSADFSGTKEVALFDDKSEAERVMDLLETSIHNEGLTFRVIEQEY